MTIASATRTAGPYSGTGTLVDYPFSFKVFAPTDVAVTQTDTAGTVTTPAYGGAYTVLLNGDQNTAPGGTVKPLVAVPVGVTWLLTSAVPATQSASLTNAGGFFPKTIEDALDRLTILSQQAITYLAGAIRVPEFGGTNLLQAAATRAGTLMGFDPVGNPTVVAMSSAPQRLLQKESQTVAAGQTVVTLSSIVYSMGIGSLMVFARGGQLRNGVDYTETSTQSFTLLTPFTRPTQLDMVAGAPVSNTVVGDATLVAVSPAGGPPTNVQALLRGESTVSPSVRGYWLDTGPGANIHRLKDRVFVGAGADYTGNQNAPIGGIYPTLSTGPTWAVTNAQVLSIASTGLMALVGMSRSSDSGGGQVTMGTAGFAEADAAGLPAWAGYYDVVRRSGGGTVYGAEYAVKNQGSNVTGDAYSLSGGALGLHLVAGGDPTYGGAATAPSTAAVNVTKGATAIGTWNMGMRFQAGALTVDGSGHSVAATMGQGMVYQWMVSAGVLGAQIRSDVNTSGDDVGLVFSNNVVEMQGASGARIARGLHVANGVNNLRLQNNATTGAPAICAEGTDTVVGIAYIGKGQATQSFYSFGSTANEEFRVGGIATAPVNFLWAQGTNAAAGAAILQAAGADGVIDVFIRPKSTGLLRVDTPTTVATTPANFTADRIFTFKDSSGTTYRIPCRASAW